MHAQIVMDHTGDTRHDFDPSNAQAVKQAEERFKELTGLGFTPAERTPEGSKLARAFNPAAEETVFFPRLKGG